jgi:hypothetical protein
MKYKNPNIMSEPVGCYKPKKKDIKAKLKSAKEAKDMIEDLHKNDYLPYEVALQVRGHIRIVIENYEKQLEEAE